MADIFSSLVVPPATDFGSLTVPSGGWTGNLIDTLSAPKSVGGLSDLTSAIDQIGKGYVGAVQSYYGAKGAVADAKLNQYGSPYTQFVQGGRGAFSIPPTNLLLFGGLGIAALLLLGGGGKKR